jgi:hypothetical protein
MVETLVKNRRIPGPDPKMITLGERSPSVQKLKSALLAFAYRLKTDY